MAAPLVLAHPTYSDRLLADKVPPDSSAIEQPSKASERLPEEFVFAPNVANDEAAAKILRWCVRQIESCNGDRAALDHIRTAAFEKAAALGPAIAVEISCCASILMDLGAQGWLFGIRRGRIILAPPRVVAGVAARKAQVRARHHVERDAQLATPSVRKFISDLERQRPYKGQWHSIFSLMRDGSELARALERAGSEPEELRDKALAEIVDPYVQAISTEEVCTFTGIRLLDAWRYFRHTWSISYKSTPGRKLFFLIRDRAAPNHPVIGIGALGSAIVQLGARDKWIGWTGPEILGRLSADPSVSWATWLDRSLKELLAGHRVDDLLRATRLKPHILEHPSDEALERLRNLAKRSRGKHRMAPQRVRHKSASKANEADWENLSSTHLFRAKRAEATAALLEARMRLQNAGFVTPSAGNLKKALSDTDARRAIETIVRYVKARHVGVDMMDITVCGAIAPYNAILGGKLVSLLMASPDVVAAYASRYGGASSVIASSMAGEAITRRPRLVLLGTTSLYDVAPSQYNRLTVPRHAIGNAPADLAFIKIGVTEGYGSHQFSELTLKLLGKVVARTQAGRRVNSIFGEGVNPKLRKVRGALDVLGLPSDKLLQHGSPRLIYGVPLAVNFREVLLGYEKRPEYIVPSGQSGTQMIASYWRRRWLTNRMRQPSVIQAAAAHSLAHPIVHGARVKLPTLMEDGPLFSG